MIDTYSSAGRLSSHLLHMLLLQLLLLLIPFSCCPHAAAAAPPLLPLLLPCLCFAHRESFDHRTTRLYKTVNRQSASNSALSRHWTTTPTIYRRQDWTSAQEHRKGRDTPHRRTAAPPYRTGRRTPTRREHRSRNTDDTWAPERCQQRSSDCKLFWNWLKRTPAWNNSAISIGEVRYSWSWIFAPS